MTYIPSRIRGVDHVQLAMPAGHEDDARGFYTGVLGLQEVPKPEQLARRGGVWFEGDGLKIHLGVEKEFRPARKAHVAFVVDNVRALAQLCAERGLDVAEAEQIEGWFRLYVSDPFGNRLELMQPA